MKTLTSTIFLIGLPVAIAIAAPDIEVQKAVNNEFPTANEPVEFTVQANNIGDQSATGVTVVDQLPAEMAIPTGAAAFPSVGTYDPATGEWAIGDLDSGVDAILVVPAVVTEPMPPDCIVNSAQSNFADVLGDSNDEARAAIHQTGVERCVDLVVDFGISASALTVFPDCDSFDRYTGDASVTNHGPDTARNVVVSIGQNPVVGPNLRFDDPDCSNAAASDCNIDEIAAGETVTINVTSDLYQSYEDVLQTLLVSATTSDSDYDLSNNDPSVSDSAGGFSSCMEIDFGLGDLGIGGPACFVATAAYGSPLDSRLDTLRGFRDRFMMINAPGRALVRFYYRNSPPYADYIAKRNWLRAAVRGFLAPIVFAIEYPGWAAFLIIGLLSAVVTRRIRSPRANLPTSRLQ